MLLGTCDHMLNLYQNTRGGVSYVDAETLLSGGVRQANHYAIRALSRLMQRTKPRLNESGINLVRRDLF